ncbi:DUF4351 domain-containing protein [Planctomycetota bacterium]
MEPPILRRLQQRARELVRAALVSGETLSTEKPLPESSRAIDMLTVVGKPAALWGVLRREVAHRPLLVEHYSRPPSPLNLATTLLKGSWVLEQWLAGCWPTRVGPLVLVLSVGRPRNALSLFSEVRPVGGTRGLYRAPGGLDVVLVDVKGLPVRDDTAFLRLFDHRPQAVIQNLQRLLGSESVGILEKERVKEAIMKNPAVFDPAERNLTYQEAVALGRLEEAKRVLVRLGTRRFGELEPLKRAAINSLESLDELEKLTDGLLEAADWDDLLSNNT